jgi:15-cis-phytoene synthase
VSSREAYRHCESLTRACAANFYYGIRLLPAHKRSAICAVYAFARRVDDIADGPMASDEKLRLLALAEQAAREPSRASNDPVMVALADVHESFGLPLDALTDLIAGVRMDVNGTRYEHFDELVLYCRRVAGSIGRLCVAIFGARETERASLLADDLGVAMQLTNILRDLREDAESGRVYLPAEDLRRFGVPRDGAFAGDPERLEELLLFEVSRAREWFDRGLELVGLLDHRSAACVLAMTGIYRRLLERIERRPWLSARERVSLPVWEKAWVAGRSMVGAAR